MIFELEANMFYTVCFRTARDAESNAFPPFISRDLSLGGVSFFPPSPLFLFLFRTCLHHGTLVDLELSMHTHQDGLKLTDRQLPQFPKCWD